MTKKNEETTLPELSLEELVIGIAEALKVSLAAQIARLLTATHDENGVEIPDDEMQAELTSHFNSVVDETEATLSHVLTNIALLKRE